jgi:opacity protein-like surface antigen
MIRKLIVSVAIVLVALGAAPANASADWLFTPFVGGTFGGDSRGERITYGGALGFMGAGVLGLEVDFNYAPNFFEEREFFAFPDDSNVTTLMANLMVGAPIGGVRPYFTGGAGLLRTQVTSADNFFDIDDNSWGMNVGAGVMGFFSDHAGVRGDIRYFRRLQGDDTEIDLGQFDFWRGTVGLTFRW